MKLDLDFADIRPSVFNFAQITIIAILGIVLLKFITARYRIPGVSELVHAV